MSMITPEVREKVDKVQSFALIAGVIGLLVTGGLIAVQPKETLQSYLISFLYFFSFSLGSLALLMIQHVAGGVWGFAMRRLLEAGARCLLLLAILFLPILLLGLKEIYVWADHEIAQKDHIIELKSGYLNVPFFTARYFIFFGIWSFLALALSKLSKQEDETAEARIGFWFKALSGPGIMAFAITGGLASVDWAMSVDVHWYSTMYPVLFCFGTILSAMIFHIVAMILLYQGPDLEKHLTKNHLRDVGSFFLGFIIFWAYLTFSQYLLIWAANLKEEVPYFLNRSEGGWQLVAISLGLGHFLLPFLVLLTRDAKRIKGNLLKVACFMLFMRFVDYFFLLGPSFSPKHFAFPIGQLTSLVGIGGLWLGCFLWQWKSMPPIPVRDPRILQQPIHGV
ncbi:MAG: hypothetical protein EXR99_05945 [Gemmataceae bacterium]|nr:hypothetical protein [Gemmataceae bacterium]